MIWRVRVLALVFLISFALILIRLFYWQIIRGSELSAQGAKQYTSHVTIKPDRGDIRSKDNFPLASQRLSYLLFAEPQKIEDKKKIVKILSPLLEVEEASISAMLEQELNWVPLHDRVTPKAKESIETLGLKGLGFEQRNLRLYPEASMAAHLLGFVAGGEDGEDKGYFGLEGYYDRQLRGREGSKRILIDVFGRPILVRNPFEEEKIDGRTLVLHIDRSVQFIVENALKESIERYGAKGGSVAIMDPKTGGILAMASFPSYDPANFPEYGESFFKNPLVAESYEPGSVLKPLIMASAINENLVKPDTICTICAGPVEIGGYTIKTWNEKYYPNTTMTEVIQHSDNTGMVFVGQKLELDRLLSYLSSFGFGKLTGIDLQEETSTPVRSKDQWYPIDLATASFGQGVAVTGIQLLSAISTLANNGKMMEPHMVAEILDTEGKKIEIQPKVTRDVITPQTAKIVTEMMVNAVDKGEAHFAKDRVVKGYRIAGKTGTAQIPIAGHYDPNKTVASFVGFAPADDPKFVMLVTLNQPTSSPFGSETAAPLFFSIARELFMYYGIAPQE